jgi:Tetratricopeptide repeat
MTILRRAWHPCFRGSDERIAACSRIIDRGGSGPSRASALFSRAFIYSVRGEYDLAIRDLDDAIALHPRYSTAFNNRGYASERKGDHDRATMAMLQHIRSMLTRVRAVVIWRPTSNRCPAITPPRPANSFSSRGHDRARQLPQGSGGRCMGSDAALVQENNVPVEATRRRHGVYPAVRSFFLQPAKGAPGRSAAIQLRVGRACSISQNIQTKAIAKPTTTHKNSNVKAGAVSMAIVH